LFLFVHFAGSLLLCMVMMKLFGCFDALLDSLVSLPSSTVTSPRISIMPAMKDGFRGLV
jgi:hypothetical protein